MQDYPTELTSCAATVVNTLNDAGYDGKSIAMKVGLDPKALADPNARYPVSDAKRLWIEAVRLTGDNCFGLRASKFITHSTFHALGYSVLASSSLEELFQRIVKNFKIVSDGVNLTFTEHESEYHFTVHLPPLLHPAQESIEAVLALLLRLCRQLYSKNFNPKKVMLSRSLGEGLEGFKRYFRCPIQFNSVKNVLILPKEPLQMPLGTGNEMLAERNDQIVKEYLTLFYQEDMAVRVKKALIEQLAFGDPSQEMVAEKLHMSLRNLQRKLSQEGTTYREVLDATRQELAVFYLGKSDSSFGEIAYLLGFGDSSSFSRAFKRWFSLSPTAFREVTKQNITNGNA